MPPVRGEGEKINTHTGYTHRLPLSITIVMSFRRKIFVSGHFEPVIEPTNADAPDTQLVSRRPVLLLL